jgi:hypothetical protein
MIKGHNVISLQHGIIICSTYLTVGDEHHEEIFKRLIDIADVFGFDSGMLMASAGEFGEGGKKTFDARPLDFTELAGENNYKKTSTLCLVFYFR